MEFSRREYRSGQPFPSPGDLPSSGLEPMFTALADGFLTSEPQGKPLMYISAVRSHSVVSDSLRPTGCSSPGSSVHGASSLKNTEVGMYIYRVVYI